MNYRYKFELLMGLMVSTLLPLLHFLEVKVDLGSEIADFSIFTIFLIVIAHTLFFKSYSINSLEKKINSDVEFSAAQTLLSVSLLAVSTVTVFPGAEGVYWFGYGAKIVFIAGKFPAAGDITSFRTYIV